MSTDARRRHLETVSFFGPRAAGWDDRFGDDGPAFEHAVSVLAPPPGGIALDAGCGTGRATPALAAAVGSTGTVLALDLTPEMLDALLAAGRRAYAQPVRADALDLPLASGTVDSILAGGLLPHAPDPLACLAELARVARTGARLAVFHPIGRAALAARHRRVLSDDDVLAPARLVPLLDAAGWHTVSVDDGEALYLTIAERSAP